jgi:hypothetical protein
MLTKRIRNAVLGTFKLYSTLELIDGVLEALLIQQQLATAELLDARPRIINVDTH